MNRVFVIAVLFLSSPLLMADEYAQQRVEVLALGKLTTPPRMSDAVGYSPEGNLRAIYYDALPFEGKPTKVFAWLGMPKKTEGKVPAVVLVHGGGGSAFKEWVTKWTDQGFAAISIAVEGQTDKRQPKREGKRGPWKKHQWAGPERNGIYQDSELSLTDQWMYHAVADTVLANSLLRSLPEVDASKVGVMGISWGGVITSTVMGIDDRFAFAIPTYGCGNLSTAGNQYGKALGTNEVYKQVWDPILRMKRANMPALWFSWPEDSHFPLDCHAACYRAAPGRHMVTLAPRMRHGHGPAWSRAESYVFANGVTRAKRPWCQVVESTLSDNTFNVMFSSITKRKFDNAVLITTTDTGVTGDRKWIETKATLEQTADGHWNATQTLPAGTTAWFMNLKSGELVVSSDFHEVDTPAEESSPKPSVKKGKSFVAMDKDEDDKLVEDEYVSFFAARFDSKDTDKNGYLDSSEFKSAKAFKVGDADKDGNLTREEYETIFVRQFRNLDKNKDGCLSPAEISRK